GAELIVECDVRLIPLFQRSFPSVVFIPWTDPPTVIPGAPPTGQFSMSDDASGWFRQTFEDFPKRRSYLTPPPHLGQKLRDKYQGARINAPLIGVSWRTAEGGKTTEEKTLPLSAWGPILHMPGVTFVNLQYGATAEEIAAAQNQFNVKIESDPAIDP